MTAERWRALALGAALFAVYAAGAAPTIFVGDSGDLATAVATMGIPHPSGYPLYVLLGKVWILLVPFGSVAWRLGLFSAACAAAACVLVERICRDLQTGRLSALAAALLLAFAPSFWAEANIPRVYALNAVFVLLALRTALRWGRERRDGLLLATAFLCGLGASNHMFMAVEGALIAIWVVTIEPAVLRRGRFLLASALAAAAGLLPYLYLPIRAAANPRLNWGNPTNLSALLAVVLRRDFWGRAWMRGPADLVPITADYLRGFAVELTLAGVTLALLGIAAAWRRRSVLGLFLTIMAGNLAALALHGSRTDLFVWHRYDIPSYAVAAVLAGLGAEALGWRIPFPVRPLVLAPGLFLLITGFAPHDRSRFRIAHDFTQRVFRSLPPGAHLIAEDDNVLFALMYEHLVEGARPDVDLILEGVGGARLPPLSFQPEQDPVYLTHHPNWAVPPLTAVPVGVVFRVWLAGRPGPPRTIPDPQVLDGENDPRVPKDYLTRNLLGHFHYMLGVTLEDSDWRRARKEFRKAQTASPDNDVLFYNLGLIFAGDGLYEDAAEAFRRSSVINPRQIASSRPPPLASRRAEEMRERARKLAMRERDFGDDSRPAAAPPGSAAWHRRLAALWRERGDTTASRRHTLLAIEAADP